MNDLLLSAPAVTVAELVFVLVALAVLVAVPTSLAWVERRSHHRARESLRALQEETLTAGLSPVATQASEEASTPESSWSPWPVAPPVPSVDPWHPNEEYDVVMLHTASEKPQHPAADARGSDMERSEPEASAGRATGAQPFGAVNVWQTAAARYATLPALPAQEMGEALGCRLESLREVALATWPGPTAAMPPEVRAVWIAGQRTFERWKSQVCQLALNIEKDLVSYCLGRVETDGVVTRLHLLLFDHLWPIQADEARAVAIVDVEPSRGPVVWCVLPTNISN